MSFTDRVSVLVVLGAAGCQSTTAPPGSSAPTTPTTPSAVDTGLGEPWIQRLDSADSELAFLPLAADPPEAVPWWVDDLFVACFGVPTGYGYDGLDELVWCGEQANGGGFGWPMKAPETATAVDLDWASDDNLRERAVGFGHTLASVGDVTGDGQPDLAIGTREYGRLDLGPEEVMIDTRDWNFRLYASFVLTGTSGADRATDCKDITADGQADLCTTSGFWTGPVGQSPPATATWPQADHLVAGDFAGDGVTGLVLADGPALWWLADPGALTGAVDLGASAAAVFTVAEAVTALAVGDLDGDGVVDLAVGTGTEVVVGSLSASGGFAVAFTVPGRVDALALGDFDGDGAMDLAVGGDAEVRWFPGPLSAAAQPARVLRGPGWPDDYVGGSLASADVDGDGIWDLAIAAPNPDPEALGSWWWLEGL